MSDLERLQNAFQACVRQRDPAMLEHVLSTPAASAEQRLEIYAQAYRLRLLEALEGEYPGLHGLLGDPPSNWAERISMPVLRCIPRFAGTASTWQIFCLRNCRTANNSRWRNSRASSGPRGQVFDVPEAAPVSVDVLQSTAPQHWADLSLELHPAVRLLKPGR
ncbi:MAG: DNA-binding domain-containing protein [Gammaproteobacteria bacterium]|nr:DNA-binding domain-containing protein [Gammaproteobacteria bacterium]